MQVVAEGIATDAAGTSAALSPQDVTAVLSHPLYDVRAAALKGLLKRFGGKSRIPVHFLIAGWKVMYVML